MAKNVASLSSASLAIGQEHREHARDAVCTTSNRESITCVRMFGVHADGVHAGFSELATRFPFPASVNRPGSDIFRLKIELATASFRGSKFEFFQLVYVHFSEISPQRTGFCDPTQWRAS